MKIHEYQAKQIFRNFGVPVPNGVACMSVSDADAAIEKMMPDGDGAGGVCVVKAQIHAGGRGKGAGSRWRSRRRRRGSSRGRFLG